MRLTADYADGADGADYADETCLALHIDQVAEVPAYEVVRSRQRAGGDVPRIVLVFRRHNTLGDVGVREASFSKVPRLLAA